MALFISALAVCRAKLFFPPRHTQMVICVADRKKKRLVWKVWTKWWLCETLAKGRSGAPTVQRLILTWIINNTRPCQPSILIYVSYFHSLFKGKTCVVHCLTETSLSWILWAIFDFFRLNIRLMWASLVRNVLPRPSLEVSHSSLAAATPSAPSPPLGAGVRVPQVPHITPQLRPPVKPKASQHAASWPPVDAGRLNVTHIIIHHHGELGKEGRDGELVCERGGTRAGLICPGQLKSLQPPLWTYSTSPSLTRSPQRSLSSDG